MKKFVNFRPVLVAAIAFILGIISVYAAIISDYVISAAVGVISVAVLVLFLYFSTSKFSRKAKLAVTLAFLLVLALGGFRFYAETRSYENANLSGHYLEISGKVKEVKDNNGGEYAVIKDVRFSGALSGTTKYCISLSVNGYSGLRIGDKITFSAVINDRDLFYDGKFSASAVAEKIKYSASVFSGNIEIKDNSPDFFERINLSFYDALKKGLSGNEFAIGYALLTGNSDYMTEDVIESFRSAGVAHIFAVSGLHVGFLAAAVAFILKKLRVNRYLSYAITLLLCFIYSGVCGFTSSSLRAAIMFSVLGFAPIVGKRYDGLSSISLAAIIILAISPAQLFCPGFLLSFSVVISLSVAAPVLSGILKKIFRFLSEKICSVLAACISAQVAGIPICLFFFGNFSLIAVFVNMLLIPIIGFIFVFLFVCTVFAMIGAARVFLFLPDVILTALRYAITFFDYEIFLVCGFTFGGFSVFYYLIIPVFGGLFNLKRRVKLIVCLLLAAIVAVGVTVKTVSYNEKYKITAVGTGSFCASMIRKNDENLLVVSKMEYSFSLSRLKKVVERDGIKEAKILILNLDKNVDIQVAVSKFYDLFAVKDVYCYGEEDFSQKNLISILFKDVRLYYISDGFGMNFCGAKCRVENDGKCFILDTGSTAVAVYSELAEDTFSVSATPDIVICYDKAEYIYAAYSPREIITYIKTGDFDNTVLKGNLTVCCN